MSRSGFFSEMIRFVVREKKWWMIPILLALALIVLFVILVETPVGPMLYPLF